MSFGLASVKANEGGAAAVVVCGDRYWELAALARAMDVEALPATLADIFLQWARCHEPVMRLGAAAAQGDFAALGRPVPPEFAIPLEYPRKVFCTGANYEDHLREMNADIPKRETPFFYLKPASTSLAGPGKSVHLPAGTQQFDWEAEVVMVFGKGGRNIAPEQALDHIAGYTLGIDFTARDQFLAPDLPFKFDFALGKCQDRTAPIGPMVVPKEFVNLEDIAFSLSVNGVKKQGTTTAKMIYSLAEQIAGISRFVSIEPGDILFTGSPAGVGAATGQFLNVGDTVRVESPLTGAMETIIQPPLR